MTDIRKKSAELISKVSNESFEVEPALVRKSLQKNEGDEELYHRIDDFWLDLTEEPWSPDETMTPGLFYHGSSDLNLTEFYPNIDDPDANFMAGCYFSHNPNYAIVMAARLHRGWAGRLYRVKLNTQNPYIVHDTDAWFSEVDNDWQEQRRICKGLRDEGYDSIITRRGGIADLTIEEIIVLDPAIIVKRFAEVAPLKNWLVESTISTTFWRLPGEPGPDFAPDCVPLAAEPQTGRESVFAYGVPIYADRCSWHRFNIDALRDWGVGFLIDPLDGGALVLDPSKVVRPNRALRRASRSKYGRAAR